MPETPAARSWSLRAAAALIAGCGGGSDSARHRDSGRRRRSRPGGTGRLRLEKVGDFEQPVYVTQPPGNRRPLRGRAGRDRSDRQGRRDARHAGPRHPRRGHRGRRAGAALDRVPAGLPELARRSTRTTRGTTRTSTSSNSTSPATAASTGTASARCCTWPTSPPTTTAACCSSGRTTSSTSAPATAGIADDPQRNGQNLHSLLGKILRIDPGPAMAAVHGRPQTARTGARPRSATTACATPGASASTAGRGALLIGDVGQNTQEEIDYVPAERACGNNFGWSAFEGTNRFNADQTAPERGRADPRPTAATRAAR